MAQNVLITGSGGFIGRRLVEQLIARGHHVIATIRNGADEPAFSTPPAHDSQSADPLNAPNHPREGSLRVVRADVTRPETLAPHLQDCDWVMHLAGCTIARGRGEYDRVNRGGTIAVANQCLQTDRPPRFLFVSSLAATGPAKHESGVRESDPPRPVSDYGRSKLAAEVALRDLSDRLDVTIVRPPSVFGGLDRYMLGLFRTAKWGWAVQPGNESYRYSMIHLQDLIEATIFLTLERKESAGANCPANSMGETFHLAQPGAMSFAEVGSIVRRELGLSPTLRTLRIADPVCRSLASLNSTILTTLGFRPLLNRDKMREALAGSWIGDSTRLTEGLGFRFPCSLEQRIRQATREYQDAGLL